MTRINVLDSVGRIVFVRLGPIDGFVPRIVLIRAKNGIRVGNGKVIDFNIGRAVDRMIEIGHLCLSIVGLKKNKKIRHRTSCLFSRLFIR